MAAMTTCPAPERAEACHPHFPDHDHDIHALKCAVYKMDNNGQVTGVGGREGRVIMEFPALNFRVSFGIFQNFLRCRVEFPTVYNRVSYGI
jgi:hypothetical protein